MEDNTIERITEKLNGIISDSSLFLVDIKIKPTNNIKVFLDGDTGVTIDNVSKINRALYKQIEEEGLFPNGDFSLEVSSAGVDEPLKFLRQYKKNIGRTVAVTLNEPEPVTVEGKLTEVDDEEITIEEVLGKKKEKRERKIPFSVINKTIVQVSF